MSEKVNITRRKNHHKKRDTIKDLSNERRKFVNEGQDAEFPDPPTTNEASFAVSSDSTNYKDSGEHGRPAFELRRLHLPKPKQFSIRRWIKRIYRSLLQNILSWNFVYVLRSTLAIFIGSLFVIIRPINEWLGVTINLISFGITLSDFGNTIGANLENIVIFTGCITLGGGFASLTLWSSFDSDVGTIFYLFFWIFLLETFRARLPSKWTLPLILAITNLLFAVILGQRQQSFDISLPLKSTLNTLIGVYIAIFVSMLPIKTSHQSLQVEMNNSLITILKSFELTSKAFLLEASEEEVAKISVFRAKTKTHFMKLKSHLKAVRYEPNYCVWSSQDSKTIVNSLQSLLLHIKAMTSCCVISKKLLQRDKNIAALIERVKGLISLLKTAASINIVHLQEAIDKRDSKILDQAQDLTQLVEHFDDENNKIIAEFLENTPNTDIDPLWDDVFLMYFYIFTLRAFVLDLTLLVKFVHSNTKNKQWWIPALAEFVDWHDRKKSYSWIEREKKHKAQKRTARENRKAKCLRIRFGERLWSFFHFFESDEARFGLKVAIAVVIASCFSFIDGTADWYAGVRGEWAAYTVPLVFSPGFGSSYINSVWRILGTIVGATLAMIVWVIVGNNPYGLMGLIAVVAFILSYLKYSTPYPRVAVIGSITFLIVLWTKWSNLYKTSNKSIYELAYVRAIDITIGILIALIIDRVVWPNLARNQITNYSQ